MRFPLVLSRNTLQRCVYCLEDKLYTGNRKKGCQFSSEHVLNFAFVQGYSNNLTLIGKCCHLCNQGFNLSGLDAALTRFAPEGFSRFAAGEKDLDRINEFEKNNPITQHCVDDENSPAHDAITHYRPVKGRVPYLLPAQVLILNENGPPERILWSEFVKDGWKKIQNCTSNLKLIEDNTTSLAVMVDFVTSKVKTISEQPAENLGYDEIQNKQVVFKNTEYERALVKTAFNYLVFTSQATFPNIPYLPIFDSVRSFVKEGSDKGTDFVALKSYPTVDPTIHAKGLKHRISLLAEGSALKCNIQIFSGITWEICLPSVENSVQLCIGHIWDCDTRTIKLEVL